MKLQTRESTQIGSAVFVYFLVVVVVLVSLYRPSLCSPDCPGTLT